MPPTAWYPSLLQRVADPKADHSGYRIRPIPLSGQGITRCLDLRLTRPLEPGHQRLDRGAFLQYQPLLLDGGSELAGTAQASPVLPASTRFAQATKPSSALPVSTNCQVWPMLAPVSNRYCLGLNLEMGEGRHGGSTIGSCASIGDGEVAFPATQGRLVRGRPPFFHSPSWPMA